MILTYHKVYPESKTHWWITPDSFYLQMSDLRSKKVVYLDEYDPADPNQCVITFDGVYENIWKYAVPILKHFGYPFELFIIGQYIGKDNQFDSVEPLTNFASQEALEKMVHAGGRLQWHTWSHQKLVGEQTQQAYDHELVVPESLRALCPDGFKWFAFPHGERDDTLRRQVENHFQGALACDDGNSNDLYDLGRITVFNETRFSNTKVSVIIPCYNYGHFLAEAIESVLLQTIPPDEILVIDDASSDNSVETARRYEPQVRVEVNSRNLGVVENFKKAISLTTGDYICFLGADNRFRSDYIEKTKAVLDSNPDVGIAYTHFVLFDKRAPTIAAEMGAIPHPSIPGLFLKEFPANPQTDIRKINYIHGSSMYRRVAYDQVGGYVSDALPEDASLFARIVDRGWKAKLVDAYILEYRQHTKDQINLLKGLEVENVYLRAQHHELLRNIADKDHQIAEREVQIAEMLASRTWRVAQVLQRLRERLAPYGSRREQMLYLLLRGVQVLRHEGIGALLSILYRKLIKKKTYLKADLESIAPTVSIIIPVFNAAAFTKGCLEKLYQVTNKLPFEVIIVDNHSTDQTKRLLQAEKIKRSGLSYYRMPTNLGFGGAVNFGFRQARGSYIIILNNDTLVTPGWLDKLIEPFTQDELIGIVSPITNYVGEGSQIDPGAVEISPANIDEYAEKIQGRKYLYESSRLVFFCVAIRREVIDIIGDLDIGYEKGNYEDDDYCMRTIVGGFKLAIARGAFVYHFGSMTFKKNRISHDDYMARNRERFYQKAQNIAVALRPAKQPTRKPCVSVVVRTLNRPELLRNALISLSNQAFNDFEAVVVNDGGQDISESLGEFEKYFPINYIHNKISMGRSTALNIGIGQSKADFISFLDDDDIIYPWHMNVLFSNARENPDIHFFYSDFNVSLMRSRFEKTPLATVGIDPWEYNPQRILIQNYIPIHTWLISKGCFESFGDFIENQPMLEDFEFLVRLSKSVKFYHVKRFTCEYRYYLDGVNSMATQRAKTADALKFIYKQHPTSDPFVTSERARFLVYLERQIKQIEQLQQELNEHPEQGIKIYRQIINLITGL